MITIKEKKIEYHFWSRNYAIKEVENPTTTELNVDGILGVIIENGFSLVDDIPEKELKLKRGGYLIVINDKVLYKGNKPFYRPSLKAAKDTVKSFMNYTFMKNLSVDLTKYYIGTHYSWSNKTTCLLEDMITNDYVEIFKK